MALYHRWVVKNGFAYVLTFFSLISDGQGGVNYVGNLVEEGGGFAMIVNILTVSIILVRMLIHYREVEDLG